MTRSSPARGERARPLRASPSPLVVSDSSGRGSRAAHARHDVDEAAPDQRLTAGEAHLVDAELGHRHGHEPHDLVVGEQPLVREASRAPRPACSRCTAGCSGRSATPAGRSRRGRSGPRVAGRAVTRPSVGGAARPGCFAFVALNYRRGVRFLLTRRWVLFALAVVLLALRCVRLGEWQFHRLHDREQSNEWTRTNLAAAPAPVDDVLAVAPRRARRPGVDAGAARRARTTPPATVVRALPDPGRRVGRRPGHPAGHRHDGTALLVDRGWLPTDNTGAAPTDLPDTARRPGRGRRLGAGRRHRRRHRGRPTAPPGRSPARTIGPRPRLNRSTAGSSTRDDRDPPPAAGLCRAEQPDLGNGPHLFYGIQWWFFGALAVFGFGYLRRDECAGSRRRRRAVADDRPPTPERSRMPTPPLPEDLRRCSRSRTRR